VNAPPQAIPQLLYLSDILGHTVYDSEDREIGVLKDVAAFIGPKFPVLTKIRIRKGRETFIFRWTEVLSLDRHNLILREPRKQLDLAKLDARELLLGRNVLDKQMVDTSGRKIVRVNDVMLGLTGNVLRVTGVAIGFPSILRRLGFIGILWSLFPFLRLRDHVVPWDSVVPLDYMAPNVKLNVQMDKLARLHSADLARIVSELSVAERSMIFDSLDDDTVADIIEEFEPKEQAQILEAIEDERVPDVVGRMEPDDAADMLQVLPPEESAEILEQMEEEEAADVKELLEHEKDSAGGLMTTDFVALPAGITAGEVLAALRAKAGEDLPAENAFTIYLVDEDERLLGVTNLWDVFLAPADTPVAGFMKVPPAFADVEDDAEDAAHLVARYDLLTVPVLEDEKLVGIITVDDALDLLMPDGWKEHLRKEH
jgi:magnesium transporter